MGRPFGGGDDEGQDEAAQLRDATVEEESDEEEDNMGQEWVYEAGDEWEDPSEGGTLTQVHRAAEEGNATALPALLDALSVPIDTLGPDSDTALHLAALYGHADCVRVLLERGAAASVQDEDGGLPLHDAAAGGYADICTMLLDSDPSCINIADSEGDTPLHNAARGGHEEVVRLLISHGADATAKNEEFKTPAGLAERGTAVKQFLLELERQAAGQTP